MNNAFSEGGVGQQTSAERGHGTGLTASLQSWIWSGLLADLLDLLGQTSSASMRLMDTLEPIASVTTLLLSPFVRRSKLSSLCLLNEDLTMKLDFHMKETSQWIQ